MNWRRLTPIAMALMATMLATAPAQAAGPIVLDPSKPHYGMSYADWSAAWWQWALSISVHNPPNPKGDPDTINHPLVDTTGAKCGVGQEQQRDQHGGQYGDVWFLGGQIVQSGFSGEPTVNRTCTIPHGKALFFPPINIECSMLEGAAFFCPGNTEAKLRADIACVIAHASNLTTDLDGTSISVGPAFRVKSPTFSFTLPADDILTLQGEGPYNRGARSGLAVGDGYYVMLAPLSSGMHRLHFHGEIHAPPDPSCPASGFDFVLNVIYNLTVV